MSFKVGDIVMVKSSDCTCSLCQDELPGKELEVVYFNEAAGYLTVAYNSGSINFDLSTVKFIKPVMENI